MSSVALVVDDDMLNRITLNHMLSKAGYTVHLATNGMEAITLLDNGLQADVILTDIEMPVMNGRQLLVALRERSGHKHVPVVALTAHSPAMQATAFLTGEFDALVEKPIEKTVLLDTLVRILATEDVPQGTC
ncbi:MAG: response regulator [Halodesulfovibrio sp.]